MNAIRKYPMHDSIQSNLVPAFVSVGHSDSHLTVPTSSQHGYGVLAPEIVGQNLKNNFVTI